MIKTLVFVSKREVLDFVFFVFINFLDSLIFVNYLTLEDADFFKTLIDDSRFCLGIFNEHTFRLWFVSKIISVLLIVICTNEMDDQWMVFNSLRKGRKDIHVRFVITTCCSRSELNFPRSNSNCHADGNFTYFFLYYYSSLSGPFPVVSTNPEVACFLRCKLTCVQLLKGT